MRDHRRPSVLRESERAAIRRRLGVVKRPSHRTQGVVNGVLVGLAVGPLILGVLWLLGVWP